MTRDNLIATPTVDKNGKTTTVYRKPASEAANASRIPAPAFVSSRPPRHVTIDAIWEHLQDKLATVKVPAYKDKMTDIFRSLSGAEDDAYVDDVLEMVSKVVPNITEPKSIRAVLIVLAGPDNGTAKSMCAHSDYLAENTSKISAFAVARKMLTETLMREPDENGHFPTIEAHIYAEEKYHETADSLGWTGGSASYRTVPHIALIVDKHPSHVNELMEFIKRDQGTVYLDDFEAYLEQGALRQGAL